MARSIVSLPCLDASTDSSSSSGEQQLIHTATITPLSAQNAIFVTPWRFCFNCQHLESARKLAGNLHIPYSTGRGETTEKADYIGGADAIL